MGARFIVADVFDGLASLEPGSVDLVMSSPPFLALRSYLPADHESKHKEIGSEPTPADFLDTLLDVVEACDRVLAPHGSLCFELGDTFAGSGGAGGDYAANGLREDQPAFDGSSARNRSLARRREYSPERGGGASAHFDNASEKGGLGWPLDKSLTCIPGLFAASLAYGRNLLRPERETPRWRVRNLVVWARPNPPVGALGDKFRPATSYLTVACKSRTRYFDLDAVRTPLAHDYPQESGRAQTKRGEKTDGQWNTLGDWDATTSAGAPPLDYWVIPTHPYPGSHYAAFPPELCVKPIKSMCPARVCRTCGEPSRRITGEPVYCNDDGSERAGLDEQWRHGRVGLEGDHLQKAGHLTRQAETLGFTDCGHDNWRAGVTLDPFGGSGTTAAVATGHGRDAILIDLDARNAELALDRVGPLLLTVETLGEKVA